MHMSFPVLPHITASIPCSSMALLSYPRHSSGGAGASQATLAAPKEVQAAHFGSLHVSLGYMADSTWNSRDKAFQKSLWLRTPTQETSEAQEES